MKENLKISERVYGSDDNDHFTRLLSICYHNNKEKSLVPIKFATPILLQQGWLDQQECMELCVQIVGYGMGGFGTNTNYDGQWMSKTVEGRNESGQLLGQVQFEFNDPMNQLIPEIYFYVNEV